MKRIFAVLLILCLAFAVVACETEEKKDEKTDGTKAEVTTNGETDVEADGEKPEGVMTHAEYIAAAKDAEVVIEAYVQATQSWWDNKITVYLQDKDGAYFAYEMACSESDAAKLTKGTKIRVSGYKTEWSGEVEIVDATFEFVEGDKWVAEATDVTALLGTDELIDHQNEFVSFKSVTVASVSYKNDEPGDDIYVDVIKGGKTYSFCVERYLTGPETDVYKAVGTLKAGDVIDIEGFLYWYVGVNTHITSVAKVTDTKSEGVMTHAEYIAAAKDAEVVIEAYVQATQSWWDNKITVYLQDLDGAYFAYEMACSESDAAKLTKGTKIRVSGYKTEWSGEVEIVDATFEIVEGNTFVAEATDVTALLGTDELIDHQNEFVSFKGMEVESIEYKNGTPGDDIYVNVSLDDKTYSFCVERYLTDPETDVYKTAGTLKAGDVIDVEGFLYWYEGVNTHITSVAKVQ